MEPKDFLKQKGLLSEDKEKFTIIQEDNTEYDLINILNEFADVKWKDKYLRLAAEFENYKKRTQLEKENLKKDVKASILESVLELDNEMSLAYKMLNDKESVKVFMDKMNKYLESQGVEEVQTDEYDPDLHEVIHMITPESDKISDVISKGYKIDGKVIKYPKIVLSK